MRLSAVILTIVLAALLPAAAQAQSTRVELHAFRSVTLTDDQFLNGVKEGQPVTITGELRLPVRRGPARLPAVVLLHGSGGLSVSHQNWAQELNAMGIAVFLVDSFTGRGIVSTSANQDTLGRLVNLRLGRGDVGLLGLELE